MNIIEIIGWLSLAFVGGYFVAGAAFVLSGLFLFRGGLEALPPCLFVAAMAGVSWVCLIAWLSPLTIGLGK